MTTESHESPLIQSLIRKRAQLQRLVRSRSTYPRRSQRIRRSSAGIVSQLASEAAAQK